jgi:hypothetical protein
MKIKIGFDNEDGIEKIKVFESLKLKGRALRRYLEVQDVLEDADRAGTFNTSHFDLMMEFIVECFGNQFTTDELLDGVDIEDIYLHYRNLSKEIQEKTTKKMKNISKN